MVIRKLIFISIYFYIIISIKHLDLSARDNYIFKPVNGYPVVLFAIVIDLSFYIILVYNNLNKSINLSSKFYVNLIINIEVDRYYYLNNCEEV